MKYIITENKLRGFIKKQFNLDLTGNIEMVTSASEVPYEFVELFSKKLLNSMMNLSGPMYLLKHLGEYYLIQPVGSDYRVLNTRQGYMSEKDLLDTLGIPPFISIMDLIDTYYKEGDEKYL